MPRNSSRTSCSFRFESVKETREKHRMEFNKRWKSDWRHLNLTPLVAYVDSKSAWRIVAFEKERTERAPRACPYKGMATHSYVDSNPLTVFAMLNLIEHSNIYEARRIIQFSWRFRPLGCRSVHLYDKSGRNSSISSNRATAAEY